MDASFKILTALQQKVLATLFDQGLGNLGYCLTGGTALAEFYLQHRYSDDLDLFTRKPRDLQSDLEYIRSSLTPSNLTVNVLQAGEQFIRLTLVLDENEMVKLELARDIGAQMAPPLVRDSIVVDSFRLLLILSAFKNLKSAPGCIVWRKMRVIILRRPDGRVSQHGLDPMHLGATLRKLDPVVSPEILNAEPRVSARERARILP